MAFNENTRVKIPALIHLSRLGYNYLSLKDLSYDEDTNIVTDIFGESLKRINPEIEFDINIVLQEVKEMLGFEDLGKSFYERLKDTSKIKLIDFENFNNNTFNVVTEFTCKNGEDEFRPDITVLVNGMPLVFIEVKKPNNKDGILAERRRIDTRFQNKKFRKFINETQFMIFSNNMEYDNDSIVPLQGAFYATTSYNKMFFNCFREEDSLINDVLGKFNEDVENEILKDNNLIAIKNSDEFILNKEITTPTNQIITSLLSLERLKTVLKYGITYVEEQLGREKHIMRYPQLFATYAIHDKLESGVKKGIIWHTQGSGKTALAYYNVAYLTDYYAKKKIIPKFYFIVDRLDLMEQAKGEFAKRGLIVKTVKSKDEFVQNIKNVSALTNHSGQREITVVNIQKFGEDSKVAKESDYDINVQRIYFLDEAHRSYDPNGCFLTNLLSSDRNAIMIALTGTPLLNKKIKTFKGTFIIKSKDIFGDYIHKYFYDKSIADGYTLKLIREGIDTYYREKLSKILKEIEVLIGTASKKLVYSHPKYVTALADYIAKDFIDSRTNYGDQTIGGMIVCDTSEQAKEMFKCFCDNHKELKTALILHDVDDKETRNDNRDAFKSGNIDLLIVYNMLLTGFDAKRLKKLYLNRVVHEQNLLQTLTRVNRPYKDFKYGYVVDFADIKQEFDDTNKEYFDELQEELGDEYKNYSDMFKDAEEIKREIEEIKDKLFVFDIDNLEEFSRQITAISSRDTVLALKKVLENARNLCNIIRQNEHNDLIDKLDYYRINQLYNLVNERLAYLNMLDTLENNVEATNIVNLALEDIEFVFEKTESSELIIADRYRDQMVKTRTAMQECFDKKDPAYVSLYEELERIFKQKKLSELSSHELSDNIMLLRGIYDRITEINRRNNLLKAKYNGDKKYARVHKRIIERTRPGAVRESIINKALLIVKGKTDEKLVDNRDYLTNDDYFSSMLMPFVCDAFESNGINMDSKGLKEIDYLVANEYLTEYRGEIA